MKRWRENPANRERERKRQERWRRAHGIKQQVHMTDEERKVLFRICNRKYYHKRMADPVQREKQNAASRLRYAKRKAFVETQRVVSATISLSA
jgi:hypothetical protein